ncbi:MAG: hypothetical protein IBX47_07515 [Desulfuromonadales bacterium]|nr:hypothetical protein [Desulfuromonadales bacterium]
MMRLLIVLMLSLLATAAGAAEQPLINVPLGDAPSRGPTDAAVTMIEFIDFNDLIVR